MSEEYPFPKDLQGQKIEHTHLLSSEPAGWDNLNLVYEIEPAGEMPESVSPDHQQFSFWRSRREHEAVSLWNWQWLNRKARSLRGNIRLNYQDTKSVFEQPEKKQTEDYISGRFG